jgi:hypothetical protein
MLRRTFFFLIFSAVGLRCISQYQKLRDFIPVDFILLDSASGDLNLDGRGDLIVILKNKFEKLVTDTTRPLLLLRGDGKGKYKLVARNDNVVLCFACGGVHGDPYERIKFQRESFTIEHFGGSGWRWTRAITFKFDARTQQVLLHRDLGRSWHIDEPRKVVKTLYNKSDYGKVIFSEFSSEKGW